MSDSRVVGQPTVPGVCDTNSLAHIIGAIPLISQIIFFSSISSSSTREPAGKMWRQATVTSDPARSINERDPNGRKPAAGFVF